MNNRFNSSKPSWAQNPVQHSNEHYRISDAELKRKVCAEDAKEKHGWSRPDWALGSNVVKKDIAVDKTSVPMPMLKKTSNSEAVLLGDKSIPSQEDIDALQRKLALAKQKAAEEEAKKDPTAGMTPEQKAKYEADKRLEALRIQTEERELAAWKANQAERLAIEKERREAAQAKARAMKKEQEEKDRAERQRQQEKLRQEKEAQLAKEAEVARQSELASPVKQQATASEIEALQQQIEALKMQLASGGTPNNDMASIQSLPVASVPEPVSPAPVVIKSPVQNKHRWSKPGWALPDEAIQQEDSIVTESIQNPGLKKPTSGYERKVFAKELAPPPVKGTFVRNVAAKKPDPRMVWIVININGMKRGKIVMHLYGNADAIVDKFFELKGLEIKRESGMLLVDELEPHFYVFGGKAAQLPKNKPQAVFGVVMEGHDVLQLALNAKDDAVISVKQSHIYPVKRAKS